MLQLQSEMEKYNSSVLLPVLAIVWKIVVLAIAGVVLIAFVVGIIAWWVHKRRKCRKDPRSEYLTG